MAGSSPTVNDKGKRGRLDANTPNTAPYPPPEKINKPVAEVSGPKVLAPTTGGLEKFQPVNFAKVHGHGVAKRSAGTKTPSAGEMVRTGRD